MQSLRCRAACATAGVLVAFCSTWLTGCGSSDLTEVHGTVTYQGKPLPEGRIGFFPDEGRPAYGEIVGGRFELTSYEPGDGAPAGKHRVIVQADKATDPDDAFSDRIPLIPVRYFDPETTELTAEVKPGEDNVFNFQLTD